MNVRRKMRLILNGKSAGDPAIRDAVRQLRSEQHQLQVRVTWEDGDASRYAAESAADDIDVVIAGGGDGTINEVCCGMMKSDDPTPALAVLPLGTANDFARGCGIPVDDPLAALQLAATGSTHAIDIGCVNERYFVNVASGGFGAEVTVNTPPNLKKALGGAAYTAMGIIKAPELSPYEIKVTLDDGTTHEGKILAFVVGNSRQCGGGQQVAPKAKIDDGLLDFVVLQEIDFFSFGQFVIEMLSPDNDENEKVVYAQTSSFHLKSDRPIQVNLDGEPMRSDEYRFRVLPKAIHVVLPPDAPVLSCNNQAE